MTSSPLPLALGFIGAGLVGGLAAHFMAPTSPAQASETSALVPGAPAESSAESTIELEALQEQLATLTRRLDMLEASGSLQGRMPVGSSELPIANEELEEAVAAVLKKQSSSGSGVQELVANTLTQIRDQEALDAEIQREQRRADAMQRRIDKLTEDLGLYPDQASKMFDVLTNEETKRNELRDAMRNGTADFSTMRDDMRSLRDESQAAIAEFLSPEQLEKYNESNSGFGFGGGRRGGGGGGGN